MAEVAGLGPYKAIGAVASGTGDVEITGAPAGRDSLAISVGDGIVAGAESSTTDGTYTFGRSTTTASALVYFIL